MSILFHIQITLDTSSIYSDIPRHPIKEIIELKKLIFHGSWNMNKNPVIIIMAGKNKMRYGN